MPNPKAVKPWTCSKCAQRVTISYYRHRKGCPGDSGTPAKGGLVGRPPRSAQTARELVAVLVAAAEGLGQDKALAAVEEATGEVLRRSQQLRLELIRSRAANARLRARLADQAEAKTLAKLDREERARLPEAAHA